MGGSPHGSRTDRLWPRFVSKGRCRAGSGCSSGCQQGRPERSAHGQDWGQRVRARSSLTWVLEPEEPGPRKREQPPHSQTECHLRAVPTTRRAAGITRKWLSACSSQPRGAGAPVGTARAKGSFCSPAPGAKPPVAPASLWLPPPHGLHPLAGSPGAPFRVAAGTPQAGSGRGGALCSWTSQLSWPPITVSAWLGFLLCVVNTPNLSWGPEVTAEPVNLNQPVPRLMTAPRAPLRPALCLHWRLMDRPRLALFCISPASRGGCGGRGARFPRGNN